MCDSNCSYYAPFGHYGPWDGFKSPLAFTSPLGYPPKKARKHDRQTQNPNPCKWTFWPLSGSCRYSGRPWGPCRPTSPYKCRGPFGSWLEKNKIPEAVLPETPWTKMCKRPYLHYGASVKAACIELRRPCTPQKPSCRYPCYPNYQNYENNQNYQCCIQYCPMIE